MSSVPNPYVRSRRGGLHPRVRRLILLSVVCGALVSYVDWIVG